MIRKRATRPQLETLNCLMPMFTFTIRELALVTVIVALAAAWWTDRRFLVADRRALVYENRVLTEKFVALKKHSAEGWHIVKKLDAAMQLYPDRSATRGTQDGPVPLPNH